MLQGKILERVNHSSVIESFGSVAHKFVNLLRRDLSATEVFKYPTTFDPLTIKQIKKTDEMFEELKAVEAGKIPNTRFIL